MSVFGFYCFGFENDFVVVGRAFDVIVEVVVQLPVKNPNVDFLIFANLFLWFGFASWLRYADEEIPVLTELVRKRRNRLR